MGQSLSNMEEKNYHRRRSVYLSKCVRKTE
jgi:hypothetical protein